jgi:hypothetical protein
MTTVDSLKNGLIEKILSIKNKNILEELDLIITSKQSDSEVFELTKEQKTMLEISEKDIQEGRLISQDAMIKRNLEWLNQQ